MQMKFTLALTLSTSVVILIVDQFSSMPGITCHVIAPNGGMTVIQLPSELQSSIAQKLVSWGGDCLSTLLSTLRGHVTLEENDHAESATAASSATTRSGKTT